MRIVNAIIFGVDRETLIKFKQFETENLVLFAIEAVVTDVALLADLINLHNPDILFVNSNNTDFNIQFIENLSVRKPKLIYVSSDKVDAYQSYLNNAVDFLLKPISSNMLIVSLYKIIKLIDMELIYQKDTIGKIKSINTLHHNFEYVAIASVDKIELLKTNEIIFCKADGKYTEFYAAENVKMVSSRNLGEYTASFDNNFFRIHHSYVVNIRHLLKIIKKDGLYCELSNGHILPVAKRRQEEFIKFINL